MKAERTRKMTTDRAICQVDKKPLLNKEVKAQDGLGDLRQQENVGHPESTKVELEGKGPESIDGGSIRRL